MFKTTKRLFAAAAVIVTAAAPSAALARAEHAPIHVTKSYDKASPTLDSGSTTTSTTPPPK